MAISFGVLLSVILKRNRKPRLVLFRERLEKEKRTALTLYQYPAKVVFCIVFIAVFAVCLEWFANELQNDLLVGGKGNNFESDFGLEFKEGRPLQQIDQTVNSNPSEQQKLSRLRILLNCIHVLEAIGLLALLSSLNLKIVKTNKRSPLIESKIHKLFTPVSTPQPYILKDGDRIQIWQMGESRFTNTNYYYSIRIVNHSTSWQVIRRSNIFSSRTAAIELAYLHQLPCSTKITKRDSCESFP